METMPLCSTWAKREHSAAKRFVVMLLSHR